MGRVILRDYGFYFEWSTVADAPTTEALTREQMLSYLDQKYTCAWENNEARLKRVDLTGTSGLYPGSDFESLFSLNRAGGNETRLSLEQFRSWMLRGGPPPIGENWEKIHKREEEVERHKG